MVIGVLLTIGLLTAGCTWWLMSYGPDTPTEYADEYGGSAAQYEVILESDDCAWLADTAAEMDERYDRERDRVAYGYQSAAVDRMVEINC